MDIAPPAGSRFDNINYYDTFLYIYLLNAHCLPFPIFLKPPVGGAGCEVPSIAACSFNSFVVFALCSLYLFFFVLFFLVIVHNRCLFAACCVLSCGLVLCVVLCLVFVPVLCPDNPPAAVLKTWLFDWTGFTAAQRIKPWLLKLLPISSVLIDWCCSISFVLQPNFVQVWLRSSSCSPADCPYTVWTLTSALLVLVLSINLTPLIILHLGLFLVNCCDRLWHVWFVRIWLFGWDTAI